MRSEDGESGDFWYAFQAYYDAHILPSTFSRLSVRERAVIMAFTDIRIEEEEKQMKKLK